MTIDSSSKKANDYLQANNRELQALFAKIKELEELNRRVLPFFDPNIANYCQVANLIGTKLIVVTANGSIATQLRFQTPELLKKFKQDVYLQKIQDIQFKVRMMPVLAALKPQPSKQPMKPLSPETANIVREIAASLDDEKLRLVMERIAERVKD